MYFRFDYKLTHACIPIDLLFIQNCFLFAEMNSIQMIIRGMHGFSQNAKTRYIPRRVG